MERVNEKQPPEVVTSDTDNATAIHPKDAPSHKQAQYKRFQAYNTGLWNGPRRENKEAMYRQDNLHRYDAIASQVGITDYQKSRGREILDGIEIRDTGKPLDHLAFAVCVIVANADCQGKRYWPHPDKTDNDEEFAAMGHDLGMDSTDQMSVIMSVKSRTGL